MLEAKNISCVREGRTLFSNLSFKLNEGEGLAIKGPNGSGKSTLLRLLAGFIPFNTSQLYWQKERILRANLFLYQQNLLYVGHKLCLHPEAGVKDQIQMWKNFYRISEQEIEQGLEMWGVDAFRYKKICHLSQGQQKRLSLSRCSWLKRPLWLLDEPETGLDKDGQTILNAVLSTHLQKGGLIVHVTHNVERKSFQKKEYIEIFF